jgi:hypothetical protein
MVKQRPLQDPWGSQGRLNRHPKLGCGIKDSVGRNTYEFDWEGGEVDAGTVYCGRLWCSKTYILLCERCAVRHGFLW